MDNEQAWYDSHERLSDEEVTKQAETFFSTPLLRRILDSVPLVVVALNVYRQLVFGNKAFKEIALHPDIRRLLGLRFGESLGCIHADAAEEGCGASPFCRNCGAANAILKALQGASDTQECRLTRSVGGEEESLDLQALFEPLRFNGQDYLLGVVLDIAHEKRLQVMERLFYHDTLNTVSAIDGLVSLIEGQCAQDAGEPISLLRLACSQLSEEIQAQKDLRAAEDGALQVTPLVINSRQFLEQIQRLLCRFQVGVGKILKVAEDSPTFILSTDATLLRRILTNMIKNAFEASKPGEIVTVGCRETTDAYEFYVANPAPLPLTAQRQLFKRSFSTKGAGRGLGTYSMKLLGERYLGGRVGFCSSESHGAEFFIALPKEVSTD